MRDIRTFFTMLKYVDNLLNRRQKRQLIWVLLLILISALFETLGVSVILPLIQVLLTPDVLMENQYVQFIMDTLGLHNALQLTVLIGIVIVAVYLLKNIVMDLATYTRLQ